MNQNHSPLPDKTGEEQDTYENELVPVCTGPPEYLLDCSLVLSATSIAHQVDLQDRTILVSPADEAWARHHLRQWLEENRDWPPPPNNLQQQPRTTDNPPTLLTIGALAIFHWITGPWQAGSTWFRAGAIDSQAILEGSQWWRLVTAMTLHADPNHLLGNCLIGGFMVHLLCRTIGYGSAWALIILTGTVANYFNIVLRSTPHYSVGFSTAVFATIGIFSGLQLMTGRWGWVRGLIVPLGAGASLLAFLGTEGKQTDLGAHLFGFACGLAAGILVQRALPFLPGWSNRSSTQLIIYLASIGLVLICWTLALHSSGGPP
ncbi:rhomboid family intramembrane serine protease [Desulfolithobacter dissulfuricans]|uniref:Rhomboid family intramembrane serine protease n=1 Tax=Desulfolithobacter dissulfuricans TaxID=2795293 RepID=A0A915U287_9BACT|nr:rhomboid family intramembrane serine protease [Desulfolithobacter dissulfuricans]BCO10004.1 rhomboid family intramembrane serine protease [Desulfolithobacter dissulfuricans]